MAEYKDITPLKKQISDVKKAINSPNSDYMTGYICALSVTEGIIAELPTADFVEVRHGEWELKSEIHQLFDDVDEQFYVECPLCHRSEYIPYELTEEKMLEYAKEHYPYCHCGAKMDGKDINVPTTGRERSDT